MAKSKITIPLRSKKTHQTNVSGIKKSIAKPLKATQKKINSPVKKLISQSISHESVTVTKQIVKQQFNLVIAPKKLVSKKQIKLGLSALLQYLEKTSKTETVLFDDEKPIFLQITSVKVPKTPTRILRLSLPHSLLIDSSEICLIVKDVGKAKEHEETVEHFEQLLNKQGITNIKTILPYHQFKTEYGNQFELKRNLLGLYDCFLVDSKVSGYVSKLLGKIFMEKRKMPAPIKMHVPHLKTHIDRTLRKTSLKVHSNSDSFIVQVGHTKMEQDEICQNTLEIIDQLQNEFPGGEDNIRALSIKTDRSIAVPVYLTLKNKSEIAVPAVRAKRPKQFVKVKGDLSTFLDKEVTVLPSGTVFINPIENNDSTHEDEMK